MFSHSTYPFHKTIEQYQPNEVIQAIRNQSDEKKQVAQINAVNSSGLTLLQLASREGMIDVAMWLLQAGADVDKTTVITQAQTSPLYLALERGHLLLAKILLAYHANTLAQQEMPFDLSLMRNDPDIKNPVLFWLIDNYEFIFDKTIFSTIINTDIKINFHMASVKIHQASYDIINLVEFAIRRGAPDEWINELARQGNISQDEIAARKLLHIYQNHFLEFDAAFSKATSQQQEKYYKLSYPEQIPDITPKQFSLYTAARLGNQQQMKMIYQNDTDLCAVLTYAYKQKNYFALKNLQSILGIELTIEFTLKNNLVDLSQFLIIANAQNPLTLANKIKEQHALLNLMLIANKQSLLHQITSYSMIKSSKSDDMLQLFHFVSHKEDKLFTTVFMKCLADRHPDKRLVEFLDNKTMTLSEILDGRNLYSYNDIITSHLTRLNYPIPKFIRTPHLNEIKQPTPKFENLDINLVTQQLIPYMEWKDVKKLSSCNKTLHTWPEKFTD